MGFLNSLFSHESPQTIEIYNPVRSFSGGTVSKSFSASPDITLKGYIWQGASAESMVSSRLKADITGVMALDCDDINIVILDGAKAVCKGVTYNIATADNILFSDELTIYPLKAFK